MSLKDEIITDPLAIGYASMTDQQVVDSLRAITRTRPRKSMTASEVLNQIVVSDFNALADADQRRIWDVLHIGGVNPFGVEARIFVNVFGGGSATITKLQAARVESISRAQELGLGIIKTGHVEEVRR